MSPLTLALIIGGIAVVMLIAGIVSTFFGGKGTIEERLDRYTGQAVAVAPAREEAPDEKKERRSILGEQLDKALAGRSFAKNISDQLARADLKLRVSEYLLLNLITVLVGAALAYFLFARFLAPIGAIVGYFAPRWYVKYLQGRRLRKFNDQLGDAINLLVNSLRSGYSMLQAMETVAKELPPPISTEFARVCTEVGLGLTLEQALNNMLRRINSDDLDLMITAINVQHEVGGNLAEILDTISYTIRERVRIKGEVRALTATARLSGYAIGFMPVAIVIIVFLLNRDYMLAMFQETCGLIMTGIAMIMVATGFFIMQKIVQIEV